MPGLLVPVPSGFTTFPNQPPWYASVKATAATSIAEIPFSGATPALEALPRISASQFSCPTAPMISSAASLLSTLKHIVAPPKSAGSSSRAPCSPLSSRTVKRSVIGGRGSLCFRSVSASVTSTAQPSAVVAAQGGGAVGDDPIALALRLRAGAQGHCVEVRGE